MSCHCYTQLLFNNNQQHSIHKFVFTNKPTPKNYIWFTYIYIYICNKVLFNLHPPMNNNGYQQCKIWHTQGTKDTRRNSEALPRMDAPFSWSNMWPWSKAKDVLMVMAMMVKMRQAKKDIRLMVFMFVGVYVA